MSGSKFIAKSVTFWGLFTAALPDLQDAITTIGAAEVVPPQYAPIVRMVGLAIALIGRFAAKKDLHIVAPK